MFVCIHRIQYDLSQLQELRRTSPMHNGNRQFLPCGCEFSDLKAVRCTCGKPGEWPNGYDANGVEMFLCQDCHEKEVDEDFWRIVCG